MNDKENYRELLGARLEAIHNAETSSQDFPSDEEILRWERLAAARLAERKAKKRKLISAAAVFLLAIAIGVAVIIGPPDVQAGGDGGAVIVDKTGEEMEIICYTTIAELPSKVKSNFLISSCWDDELNIEEIRFTRANNTMQLEIYCTDEGIGEIYINQISNNESPIIENFVFDIERKVEQNGIEIYISRDAKNLSKETYSFVYKELYVYVYCTKNSESELMNLIGEAF